jgi:type III secretory pathway component EscS
MHFRIFYTIIQSQQGVQTSTLLKNYTLNFKINLIVVFFHKYFNERVHSINLIDIDL